VQIIQISPKIYITAREAAKMSIAKGDAPIKLTKKKQINANNDEDMKVSTQRLEQNYNDRTKKKDAVPIFYGGDAESMIRSVREFKEIASDLDFTEAQEKFTNFRKCLPDVACDDWDTTKTGFPNTEAGFNGRRLEAWKQMILLEDVYENQKDYTETVTKPDLPDGVLFTRVSQAACIDGHLRQRHEEHDLQRHAFSLAREFIITTVTLAQMTDYLASEQVIADTQRENNTRGRSPHSGRHNNSGRAFTGGRGRGRHSYGRGGRTHHKRSGNWSGNWSARSDSSNTAS
jgi:hypothetical protein